MPINVEVSSGGKSWLFAGTGKSRQRQKATAGLAQDVAAMASVTKQAISRVWALVKPSQSTQIDGAIVAVLTCLNARDAVVTAVEPLKTMLEISGAMSRAFLTLIVDN